jgi:hypothetical protein
MTAWNIRHQGNGRQAAAKWNRDICEIMLKEIKLLRSFLNGWWRDGKDSQTKIDAIP